MKKNRIIPVLFAVILVLLSAGCGSEKGISGIKDDSVKAVRTDVAGQPEISSEGESIREIPKQNDFGNREKQNSEDGAGQLSENDRKRTSAENNKTEEKSGAADSDYSASKEDSGNNSKSEKQNTNDDKKLTCTISISCSVLSENTKVLKGETKSAIPEDGWLLKPVKIEFEEGDTVFDVLIDTCLKKKIHMEYTETPVFGSTYIEGIGNIYEFDAGELSGWMYSVNRVSPGYGCSEYFIKNGDVIEWQYTCDSGKDIGLKSG